MNIVGVIPAVRSEVGSDGFSCPVELLPIGYSVTDGVAQLMPLSKIITDGMVFAGVDEIVFMVDETKLDVMRYFRDGSDVGVPVSYLWQNKGASLVESINHSYHSICGRRVMAGLPGMTGKGYFTETARRHAASRPDLTVSVTQSARTDADGNLLTLTAGQLTGSLFWEPAFTDFLRETLVEWPGKTRKPTLEEMIRLAIAKGLRVKAVKLAATTFVHNPETWAKAVTMVPTPLFIPTGHQGNYRTHDD